MRIFNILTLISGISFLFYGFSALFSPELEKEFIRFGLSKFRVLTGILQLVGALGLFAGLFNKELLLLSSLGLSLLMLLGFLTRIKIGDGILLSLPSFIFLILNLTIFINTFLNYEMD